MSYDRHAERPRMDRLWENTPNPMFGLNLHDPGLPLDRLCALGSQTAQRLEARCSDPAGFAGDGLRAVAAFGEAEEAYTAALGAVEAGTEASAILLVKRSLARAGLRKMDLALEDAEAAIECNAEPVLADAYFAKGVVHQLSYRWGDATEAYKAAARAGDVGALGAMAECNRLADVEGPRIAACLGENGLMDDDIAWFMRAMEVIPVCQASEEASFERVVDAANSFLVPVLDTDDFRFFLFSRFVNSVLPLAVSLCRARQQTLLRMPSAWWDRVGNCLALPANAYALGDDRKDGAYGTCVEARLDCGMGMNAPLNEASGPALFRLLSLRIVDPYLPEFAVAKELRRSAVDGGAAIAEIATLCNFSCFNHSSIVSPLLVNLPTQPRPHAFTGLSDERGLYILMKQVVGGTADELLGDDNGGGDGDDDGGGGGMMITVDALSVRQKLQCISDLAVALCLIHLYGAGHWDLHLGNIMYDTESMRPVVIDLGQVGDGDAGPGQTADTDAARFVAFVTELFYDADGELVDVPIPVLNVWAEAVDNGFWGQVPATMEEAVAALNNPVQFIPVLGVAENEATGERILKVRVWRGGGDDGDDDGDAMVDGEWYASDERLTYGELDQALGLAARTSDAIAVILGEEDKG